MRGSRYIPVKHLHEQYTWVQVSARLIRIELRQEAFTVQRTKDIGHHTLRIQHQGLMNLKITPVGNNASAEAKRKDSKLRSWNLTA